MKVSILLSSWAIVLLATVNAQNTTFTSTIPRTTPFTSRGSTGLSTIFVPTTITTSITSSLSQPSSTSSSSSSASPSATAPPELRLDTVLDPGFGVLGALLILTGLPCAFLGHKNRWSSYFLTGFYSLSLVCLSLILKFGVLPAVNPPSKTLRGLFVLACVIAGFGGGAISILFWGQAKYFVGGLGGYALAMWIQSFHNGGLITAIGFRWVFYIGCAIVGFVLCTIPRIHYHVLLVSTAMVGATAFMLGVDCYTLVGLKEFYVYNLGFVSLFPKFSKIHFPVTQTMQIEISLIAATALAGTAIQLRILAILQIKLKQIKIEQKRRNLEIEARAAERFAEIERDLVRWEKDHGRGPSRQALLRRGSIDEPSTPDGFSNDSTAGKPHHYSGISELLTPTDEKLVDHRQSLGPLPLLNLGGDLVQGLSGENKVDAGKEKEKEKEKVAVAEEESKPSSNGRGSWLLDFDDIRKSIDWLKNDTPSTSDGNRSRKVSFLSRSQTPSQNMMDALVKPSTSPTPTRLRVQSMNILSSSPLMTNPNRERANSTPLRDEEWDAYVRERKLFTPPSGPTEPIPVSERPRSALGLVPIPESVRQAVDERRRRESLFELDPNVNPQNGSENDFAGGGAPHAAEVLNSLPAEPPRAHHRSQSIGHLPVQILPPRRQPKTEERPSVGRTRTFEELAERHKRKMLDLQRPLTEAEREQADLENAKTRWERSHRVEKREFEKRQAENQKRASQALKGKSDNRHSKRLDGQSGEQRPQGLTSTQLAGLSGTGGRRSSAVKVLNWQQQQQAEMATDVARAASPPAGNKRQSKRGTQDSGGRSVPFPQSTSRIRRDDSSKRVSENHNTRA